MQNLANDKFLSPKAQKPEAMKWLQGTSSLPKSSNWIEAMRGTAFDVFASTGLPNLKDEDWRYTNLRELSDNDFFYTNKKIDVKLPQKLIEDSFRVVLINGVYSAELSDKVDDAIIESVHKSSINGIEQYLVTVGNLEDEPLKALNAAYINDGVIIKVEAGKKVSKPIEVLFINKGDNIAIYPRNLYWLASNASAVIVENYVGVGKYFFNAYDAVVTEDNAQLKLYRVNEQGNDAFSFISSNVQQHANSNIEAMSFVTGSKLSRIEVKNEFVGKNVENSTNGLYMINGEQVCDFKVLTQHLEPHCTSHQNFKGAVDGNANAVLQGKIYVAKGAQKTDGYQMHKSILLSDTAKAQYKPELEIYADDVKCSHGATSGQLDKDALFYMQNRGLSKTEAKKILTQAFLGELLEKVSFEPIKEIFAERIEKWLSR